MSERRRVERLGSRAPPSDGVSGELKFLQVHTQDESGGGWYRELDDSQIEVLTRAHLERVQVGKTDNAETAARGKIAELMSKRRESPNEKAH